MHAASKAVTKRTSQEKLMTSSLNTLFYYTYLAPVSTKTQLKKYIHIQMQQSKFHKIIKGCSCSEKIRTFNKPSYQELHKNMNPDLQVLWLFDSENQHVYLPNTVGIKVFSIGHWSGRPTKIILNIFFSYLRLE